MKLFDVYPLYPIEIVRAMGTKLWDSAGKEYLDFYGGHAVISIGHTHPHYLWRITEQLSRIGFYSNSIINPLQLELAALLGELSGYEDYALFLCNSGAEANENAFKLASFHTGKKKILSFKNGFHGRTAAAVAATDDASIIAPVNESEHFIFAPLNDLEKLEEIFGIHHRVLAAVVIEGIQGIGGIYEAEANFMLALQDLCRRYNVLLILDEIQSGYGRTGKFFAHQHHPAIMPQIITVAKGMGNGFPVAGVLIHPDIPPKHKMLGTTFGGNHLACAAALAVLEVIKEERLLAHAQTKGEYLTLALSDISALKAVRGRGLMIGIDFEMPAATIAKPLLQEFGIFTGTSKFPHIMRLLPPLNITQAEIDYFVQSLGQVCCRFSVLQ